MGEGDSSSLEPGGILAEDVTSTTSTTHSLSFLAASRSGHNLYEECYDLVESFTTRKLSNASDKFAAISGTAMKYRYCRAGDQYLAGLWMDTLSQDLAWRTPVYMLENNGSSLDEGRNLIPSWSWASLPLGHPALMRRRKRSGDDEAKNDHLVKPLLQIEDRNRAVSSPMARYIVIAGQMRPLLTHHSQSVDWAEISVGNGEGQDEKFSFIHHVAKDIHSVDTGRGLLLVYEAYREETLGYIDYLTDADRVCQDVAKLECLELGKSEMLLIELCLDEDLVAEEDEEDESRRRVSRSYRRVGVSWNFRQDFFERAGQARIELL